MAQPAADERAAPRHHQPRDGSLARRLPRHAAGGAAAAVISASRGGSALEIRPWYDYGLSHRGQGAAMAAPRARRPTRKASSKVVRLEPQARRTRAADENP